MANLTSSFRSTTVIKMANPEDTVETLEFEENEEKRRVEAEKVKQPRHYWRELFIVPKDTDDEIPR